MNNQKKNPIALQSKKWLVDALLLLMMEGRPFQSITIKDITDKALLSRRTFYRNFTSKEELLSFHFRILCEEYIAFLRTRSHRLLPDITFVFFEFWYKHLDFLNLLKANNLFGLLLENLNDFIPDVYDIFKGNLKEYDSEEDLRYALAFSAGGFWNMLSLWLEDGNVKSPQQLSKVIRDAIRVSLKEDESMV